MYRKFSRVLEDWNNNSSFIPLMVVGARQTGKTYILDEFCRKEFNSYVYINLEKEEGITSIFEETVNPVDVIKHIEISKNINIDVQNTVIFFDEIQVSERAIMALKYFCEEEKYHIVCAGSLLGVKLRRFNSSFPVGKVIIKYLYPMDFEEFMLATGNEKLLEEISLCFSNSSKMLDSLHNKCLDIYKSYLCIGGMPQAVEDYINKEQNLMSFNRDIHSNIITAYIADMRKYVISAEESIKIQSIYESIPKQLGNDNKKFKYSNVSKNSNKRQYELPLDWLLASNMIVKCKKIKVPEMPLSIYEEEDNFKIYLSDVGLLNYLANVNFSDIMLDGNFLFKGAITENYIANTFTTNGFSIYFWRSKYEAEIDFILQREGGIIPVEVKSSINTKSKSLNEYINKYNPKYSIRLSMKNFGFDNNIYSIPLYAAFLIKK